ncbi:solute carrier family 35 member G1-like [Clavelina lepadiformis]|uniref:solute carrier family 35 member G1-like n=1 Tax=Clavelina lepadiformis TaxID=159417 RepID=UPI0040410ED8
MSELKYQPLASSETQFEEIEMKRFREPNPNEKLAVLVKQQPHCLTKMRGYICAFSSCVFFATGSMFVKLSAGSLTSVQVVMIRCFVQLAVCLVVITQKRLELWKFANTTRALLVVRGTCGGVALVFYFYAFQNMPLGNASAIIFSSPIYTIILARIFLKEKIGALEFIVLICGLIGVVLIARPSFIFPNETIATNNSHHRNLTTISVTQPVDKYKDVLLGRLSALLGALTASVSFIALRTLPKVHFVIPIFYFSVIGVTATSVISISTQSFPLQLNALPWMYAFFVGVCGISGQILMTVAFQTENAGPVSIIRQLDLVFAYLLQTVIFHDFLNYLSVLGALLIMSGSLAVAVKKWLKSTNKV